MPDSEIERQQEEAAAAEAGAIGGRVDRGADEAARPLAEAGQGESEGFEEAEEELIEHASHGDQHAARRVIGDAPSAVDDPRAAEGGESDALRSTELEEDEP